MGIADIVGPNRKRIMRAAARRGARNLRVFGSAATGRATKHSDVDFLIDMERGRTLVDLVGFAQDVEGILGRRVDVVTTSGLSPYLRQNIISSAVPL